MSQSSRRSGSSSSAAATTERRKARRKGSAALPPPVPEHAAGVADEAAAEPAVSLAPALRLDRTRLLQSVPFSVTKQHPVSLQHCLRHALLPAAASALLSPATRLKSPRPASSLLVSPEASPLAAATVTEPLQQAGLGIRSLIWVRTQPLLVACTAECVFVWRYQCDEDATAASVEQQWQCTAILPAAALIDCDETALPCPVQSCPSCVAPLPRATAGPLPSAMLPCLSADESVLYIAINQPARSVSSPSSAVLHSPAGAAFPSSTLRSPVPTASQPSLSTVERSPNVERDFDALMSVLDESVPTATPAATPSKPASTRKGKRKLPAAAAQPIVLPPVYTVYALRLTGAAPPVVSVVASPRVVRKSPQAAASGTTGLADDDMDSMMSSLLHEMTASPDITAAPATPTHNNANSNRCTHLRRLFTTSAPITALACGDDGTLLIGDESGTVSGWCADELAQWSKHYSVPTSCANAPVTAIAPLSLQLDSSADGASSALCLVTHQSAHLNVVDAQQATVLHTVEATLHAGEPAIPAPTALSSDSQGAIPETPLSAMDSSSDVQEDDPTALPTLPLVHAAAAVVGSQPTGNMQQVLLVSPPRCSELDGASGIPSGSQPARKSARKIAASASNLPLPPCSAALPSVVALRMASPSTPQGQLRLAAHRFSLPLLLTDDNPAVHPTAIATSCSSLQQLHAKQQLLPAIAESSLPSPLLATGLSTGALLLHSTDSTRLVAMLSDEDSGMLNENGSEGVPPPPACDRCNVHASAWDELLAAPTQASPALSAPAYSPLVSAPRGCSPVPSSQSSAPRASQRRRAGSQRARSPIALSPPRSPAIGAVPAALAAKHVCTRAITAIAFHPLFHALLAVGDQRGHVHIYAPADAQQA